MKITPVAPLPGKLIGPYRRHAQDGTAHLTYYRADLLLSFVWDCNPAHPIEVEHGGYGEDLTATLTLDESDLPESLPSIPHGWMAWFKLVCDHAALTFPRPIEPDW